MCKFCHLYLILILQVQVIPTTNLGSSSDLLENAVLRITLAVVFPYFDVFLMFSNTVLRGMYKTCLSFTSKGNESPGSSTGAVTMTISDAGFPWMLCPDSRCRGRALCCVFSPCSAQQRGAGSCTWLGFSGGDVNNLLADLFCNSTTSQIYKQIGFYSQELREEGM